MPPIKPTLTDVARLAGVSEITVSRVVRGKGPIAAETRERVRRAVETLGYVPNRAAGTLASAASLFIGVILPSMHNIVFPEVLRGIYEGLAGSPYQPLLGVTEYNREKEQEILASLLAWQPMAIITAGSDHTETTRRLLLESGVRVAELMDTDGDPVDLAVGFSHRQAGYDSGKHLISRGYRRFGYVGHDWDADRRARFRYEGLVAALAEAGLSLAGEVHVDGPSSAKAGTEMLAKLLGAAPDIDVAVFVNDDMAVGGYFHCLSAGIAVKDGLALFGFNGLDIGQAIPLPLSTVRSDRFLIGRIAAERIIAEPKRPAETAIVDTGYEILEGATA
ncbi:LacI family DNA-binding transcriptional regulator [Rhizobium sp. TRM95111]|uniref:LacI family DNA-binding transcriptional regulator n=1 Tax=Rhizobium alarense TaxID=2846851 RepID=UPI001F336F87|nr:LacI family DNA-binding transcriptional regulator [Rhizobium alarense]MCF3641215.1 LacI family DNA-binding transcriptional regulator [Rhizobium alarense]